MSIANNPSYEELQEHVVVERNDFAQVAKSICEDALSDAKEQLHPLLRSVELDRLDRREEFIRSFKFALEQRIVQKVAAWQPNVQAIFKFEEVPIENRCSWDGSIHLLVKVPRLSNAIKSFGKMLDQSLVHYLKKLKWSRFRGHQSILEIQQVTQNELHHAVSYGAMFCAVYNIPMKVWPPKARET